MSTILLVTLVLAALAALGALGGPLGAVGRGALLLLAFASGAAAAFCVYAGVAWQDRGAGLFLLLAPVAAVVSGICFALWRGAALSARLRGLPENHPDRRVAEARQGTLWRLLRSMREPEKERRN